MPKLKPTYNVTIDSPLFKGIDYDAWFDNSGHVITLGDELYVADVGVNRDYTITLYTEKYVLDHYNITVKVEPKNNE